MAWSPSGDVLAVAYADGYVRLYDSQDGTRRANFGNLASNLPVDLAFSPDGNRLATATAQTSVVLWQVPTGRNVLDLARNVTIAAAAAFSPDGSMIATADRDGTVKLWSGAVYAAGD